MSIYTMHDFAALVAKIRPFTMVPETSLIELARQVCAILTFNIPGDFVECGVWRGGSSFLIAELLRQAGVQDRKVWLFDSFEGLPPPQEIDGAVAMTYAQRPEDPWYHDNCSASLEDVRSSAEALGLSAYTHCVKGWFDQTLPVHRQRLGPIALLRVDGDWYASVRCCLEQLYDQVVDGGLVVLDDYYAWDGCAIAAHEFLGSRRLAHRIEGVLGQAAGEEGYQTAVFRKGAGKVTWQWIYQMYLVTQDIASVMPAGATFILADQAQFGSMVALQRQAIPFLEHQGQYWGPPQDDAMAISEFERLRAAGAQFLVFGWPAFWWVAYYTVFHHYLRSQFPCVLHNARLMVFDVRQRP